MNDDNVVTAVVEALDSVTLPMAKCRYRVSVRRPDSGGLRVYDGNKVYTLGDGETASFVSVRKYPKWLFKVPIVRAFLKQSYRYVLKNRFSKPYFRDGSSLLVCDIIQ